MTLTHIPTRVTVEGEVSPGRYTRGQMRDAKQRLHSRLFAELEAKVARHLRLRSRIPRDTHPTYWHHPELDKPKHRKRLQEWLRSRRERGDSAGR